VAGRAKRLCRFTDGHAQHGAESPNSDARKRGLRTDAVVLLELVVPWLLNDDNTLNVSNPTAPTPPTPNPQGTPFTPLP
jgi:hypothetical protein